MAACEICKVVKNKSGNRSNTAFVIFSEAKYYVIKLRDEFRHTVGFRCISLCDCAAFRFRALSFMLRRLCNDVSLASVFVA